MYESHSTYFSNDGKRTAEVKRNLDGFYVELLEDGVIRQVRNLYNHSGAYAEDCAENYVLGIFNI